MPAWATHGSLEIIPGPAHQIDKDVLERRLRTLPFEVLAFPIGRNRRLELIGIAPGHVRPGAERRHLVDAGLVVELFTSALSPSPSRALTMYVVRCEDSMTSSTVPRASS